MSRDWTPEELQAASAAMKQAGQMGYEEVVAEAVRQVLREREHFAAAARELFLNGNSWSDRAKQVVRELTEKKKDT